MVDVVCDNHHGDWRAEWWGHQWGTVNLWGGNWTPSHWYVSSHGCFHTCIHRLWTDVLINILLCVEMYERFDVPHYKRDFFQTAQLDCLVGCLQHIHDPCFLSSLLLHFPVSLWKKHLFFFSCHKHKVTVSHLSLCSGVRVLSLGHLQDPDGPVLAGGGAAGGLRLLLHWPLRGGFGGAWPCQAVVQRRPGRLGCLSRLQGDEFD